MQSLKSGARKKPWRVGSSELGKDRTHPCSRFPFLSFSLCCGSFFKDQSALVRCRHAQHYNNNSSHSEHFDLWKTNHNRGRMKEKENENTDASWCWEYARAEWAFRVVQGGNPFWEPMSRRMESVIDATGSWTKTVLNMCCQQTRLVPRNWCFSTPPMHMKQRKNWSEKINGKKLWQKKALSWQHVQVHLISNARATPNFSKLVKLPAQAAALLRRFGRTGHCAVRFDKV